MGFRERLFDVGGITLYARCWGQEEATPLLALHGWLDNCASFDDLAGVLSKNYYIVCLDLAGHGSSEHRGYLGAYNIWQDIAEIFAVADQLGWGQFNLIGHSRGAMIAFLASGTFPERIAHLIMLEGIAPITAEPDEAPEILAKSISFLHACQRREKPVYGTFGEAVQARERGFVPVSHQDALCLARHGVQKNSKGYVWRHDNKLMAGSEVRFSHAHVNAFKRRLSAKSLLVMAEDGQLLIHQPGVTALTDTMERLEIVVVPGGHHFHMSEGGNHLASVVDLFLTAT